MTCDKCDLKARHETDLIHNTFGTYCRPCWMKISNAMNVDEWARFMKAEHPTIDKAWND